MGVEADLIAITKATARERLLIAAQRVEQVEPGDQMRAILDASAALRAAEIPSALIGGIAVGIHAAIPRATMNVDLAVPTSVERATAIASMKGAGFSLGGRFEHSLNFRAADGEPVRVAFDPMLDSMIARAETVEVFGASIQIVRRDDLIVMKERAAADPKRRRSKALRDQADVGAPPGRHARRRRRLVATQDAASVSPSRLHNLT